MARAPYVHVNVRAPEAGRRPGANDIVETVAEEIRAGRLPAGCRLPPVRALEHQLGTSKNTVQAAYEELVARGLLEAREREGVFVAAQREASVDHDRAPVVEAPALPVRPFPSFAHPSPKAAIALSTVFVDPELLPRDKLAECARSILRTPGLLTHYDAQGLPALREAIAARLRGRGMEVDADEIVVTTGSQQALDLVARVLDARRIAMEDPVYSHARRLFEGHGLQTIGLPLDPFGEVPLDRWADALARERPGALYAITSFQNPTGYSYSTHELRAILELARAHGFALVEDDWGSDMLSGSEYRPTLRALGGRNVVYVNSFTKKLLPSLRVGYLVASRATVPAFVAAKRLSILGNATLMEAIVTEFLERGYYDGHLERLQAALDRRYERCLAVLREVMPEGVRWTTPGGGPTLWLDVPRRVALDDLSARLAARGVSIEASQPAFFGPPHLHGFRVSYAYLREDVMRRALAIVAEEIREVLER